MSRPISTWITGNQICLQRYWFPLSWQLNSQWIRYVIDVPYFQSFLERTELTISTQVTISTWQFQLIKIFTGFSSVLLFFVHSLVISFLNVSQFLHGVPVFVCVQHPSPPVTWFQLFIESLARVQFIWLDLVCIKTKNERIYNSA